VSSVTPRRPPWSGAGERSFLYLKGYETSLIWLKKYTVEGKVAREKQRVGCRD